MRTAASTCVHSALCSLCPVIAALGACTASSEDVRAPEDRLFFPAGLAVDRDVLGVGEPGLSNVIFVANANAELRYDSGSIGVVDLDRVQQVLDAWKAKDDGDCSADVEHAETLVCDVAKFLIAGASVRIGNFATDIAVQNISPGAVPLPPVPTRLRVIVPTRGDPSIAWADYDVSARALSCGDGAGFALCDDAHRLTFVNNDPAQTAIPDEPFGVFADSDNGFALVTHQTGAAVTLIDSRNDGSDAVVSDIQGGFFAADLTTGVRAATGVAGRISPPRMTTKLDPNGTPVPTTVVDDLLYVGSRTDSRIQTLSVARPANNAPPFLTAGGFFFLDAVGAFAGGSGDARGLRFSQGGDRLYAVNRLPPSLHVYDTSLSEQGAPRNRLAGASDICRQATAVTSIDLGPLGGERAYVTCFQSGELYVIDPSGTSHVDAIVTVGRGPYAIAGSATRKQIYVSNFLEDSIAVVDVDPGSATLNRVVLRIVNPRAQ